MYWEIQGQHGVPPDEAATSSGKGWYSSYHTIQTESAIHTWLLYVNFHVFTTEMLGGFWMWALRYIRGVKCGRILTPRSWFLTRVSFVAVSYCRRGTLSEKSEFADKLRLFVIPVYVKGYWIIVAFLYLTLI